MINFIFSNKIKIIFLALICLLLCACSHTQSMNEFNKKYYSGNEIGAYNFALKEAGDSGDVLWNLQAGISALDSGKDALNPLQQGEELFSKYESEGLLNGLLANVGAILVNENAKDYRGSIYEGVAYNYYKALNAMSVKNYPLARVEFNRANDRQRRAKDYFHKDIQKALANQESSQYESNSIITSALQANYSNLSNFRAYAGFVNPAISYVSGLFFMSENDFSKAIDLFKESYGITHSNIIDEDVKILNKRKNGDKKPYTWFIIEDGKSAAKHSQTFEMPTYLVSSSVLYIGLSVPMLVLGENAATTYHALLESNQKIIAQEVGNIDLVIANEFDKQLPFITSRAIASAITKATTQAIGGVVAQTSDDGISSLIGLLFQVGSTIYSAATNEADIRISSALPKRILSLRVPNEVDSFSILADGYVLYKVHFTNECDTHNTRKIKSNDIFLCKNNDNILRLRIKNKKHTNYQILKGGI